MIVRVTEERLTVTELSYDVNVPVGTDMDEIESYLVRSRDRVSEILTRTQYEITNTEVLDG